ncbi:MAG: hypothetical protein QOK20_428 [Acidimicrobiaceae bacterium]|nr:hypothetical protein [Acidimicrobiaceae bacterium]
MGSIAPAALRRFADGGHRFEIVGDRTSFSISISGSGRGAFVAVPDGTWSDAFDDPEVAAAAENAASADPAALLVLCADLDARFTLTVVHDAEAAGCHWLRTTAALTRLLEAPDWPAVLGRFLSGPRVTVVGDGASAAVVCGSLVIRGPDSTVTSPVGGPDTGAAAFSGAAFMVTDPRRGLPRPTQVAPVDHVGLDDAAQLLRGAGASLTWLWIGSSASIDPGPPRVRFQGALPLDVDLPARRSPDASAEMALWHWLADGDDTGRRDATQQAVVIVVRDADDLPGAAPRVLSAARFLHQAGQRGLLAEALAARWSARDAAASAARTAADTARSVARSTFDRVLVQIAGAAGLLVAARGGLLDRTVAIALACAIAALLLGTAFNALLFDYNSAQTAIDAFTTDLDVYGDALTPADIEEVRNMTALSDARQSLHRAKKATGWTVTVAGTVLVGLLVAAVLSA